MVVPLGATTALMCEPALQSPATWYRNGVKVATVAHDRNASFRNRTAPSETAQNMPQVGFLTIFNATKDDQGEFWCRRDVDGFAGDVFYLRIAFVDPIPASEKVTIEPDVPRLGHPFVAHCPVPDAFPKPKVSWRLNDLPLSHVSSDFVIFSNGTLLIRRFSFHHFGSFECHVTNFAGLTSASIFVDSSAYTQETTKTFTFTGCTAAMKNSIFMFLMGCLVTSSAVLVYLSCVVFLLRPSRSRRTLRPAFWARAEPYLAPGFRKAVVPLPDCFLTPTTVLNPESG